MTTSIGDSRLPWRADPWRTAITFASATHRHAVLLLVVFALIAFLPGFFGIPPIDRDESRFAQATKQMLESGDYVDIRFQNEVRYKKPVGIYWLQAGAVKAAEALGVPEARTTIWLYRLPSLLAAIGAVLLTYWTALAFVSRRAAVLAALMLATSILLGVEARLAKTDAMLLMTVVAAMGALARLYLRDDRRRPQSGLASWQLPAIFWTAIAAGILLKGPVILLFVGLAIATLAVVDRSARWLKTLRPVAGLVWLLILVLPWFVAILGRAGSSFLAESVGQDLFAKIVSSQESHGAPPGYYFALFWITFWPGATLAGLAVPAIWQSRREKGARFLLAWVVPSWIALEIVVTKLPHYVLPLYPAVAILIAGVLDQHMLSRDRRLTWGTLWWFAFPVIIGVLAIGLLMVVGRQFGLLAWLIAAAAVILGLFAWWLYESDGAERSLVRAMATSVLISLAVYGVVLTALGPVFPAQAVERALRESDCPRPAVAAAGYHEPSLVFLLGTETRLTDASGAADFLHGGGCRFALVEARQERAFLRRAQATGLRYTLGPRIDGFNIAIGRRASIAVYRAGAAP